MLLGAMGQAGPEILMGGVKLWSSSCGMESWQAWTTGTHYSKAIIMQNLEPEFRAALLACLPSSHAFSIGYRTVIVSIASSYPRRLLVLILLTSEVEEISHWIGSRRRRVCRFVRKPSSPQDPVASRTSLSGLRGVKLPCNRNLAHPAAPTIPIIIALSVRQFPETIQLPMPS